MPDDTRTRQRRDLLEEVALILGGTPRRSAALVGIRGDHIQLVLVWPYGSDHLHVHRALNEPIGENRPEPTGALVLYDIPPMGVQAFITLAHEAPPVSGIEIRDELLAINGRFWPVDDLDASAHGTFVTGDYLPRHDVPTSPRLAPSSIQHRDACAAMVQELRSASPRPDPALPIGIRDAVREAMLEGQNAATDGRLMFLLTSTAGQAAAMSAMRNWPDIAESGFWEGLLRHASGAWRSQVAVVAAYCAWLAGEKDLALDAVAEIHQDEDSMSDPLHMALAAVVTRSFRPVPARFRSLPVPSTEPSTDAFAIAVQEEAASADRVAHDAIAEMLAYITAERTTAAARIEAWCQAAVSAAWWHHTADIITRISDACPNERLAALAELLRRDATPAAIQRSDAERLVARATSRAKAACQKAALRLLREHLTQI